MDIVKYEWAVSMMLKANEFWFYALICAVLLGLRRGERRTLLANTLDLAVPGTAAGFFNFSSATVGIAMLLSTALATPDVWRQIRTTSSNVSPT